MSTSLLVQTVVAGFIAASLLLVFAARFSAGRRWVPAALATLALDQGTKWAAQPRLRGGRPLHLLGGRLVVTYDLNQMQGFGSTFAGILLVTLVMAVLAALLYRGLAERGYQMAGSSAVACGLMAGGFSGIAVDRAFRRAAVDLIYFGPSGPYLYNVADLAVFAGFILLALRLLLLAPEAWRHRSTICAQLAGSGEEAR